MSSQHNTIIIRHQCDNPACEAQGEQVLEIVDGYLIVVEREESEPPEVHTNVCAHRVGHMIGAAATAAADIGCDEPEDSDLERHPSKDVLIN